ncbi:hth domain-containing protein [Halosimplex carlsbadense 2-9-1]|uniref:Hth domain-containing protein n=1 Tax=Halosimplex carlsbadense 2-9-1 TaxID=797114 RepID=M0CBE2_9EURY|nr:winged helix-turn-helix domain-containing protein [Halosimplex carlsbadense]ELZ20596.1 hth domain-containing protein [Halosimplex carlsbadense 2-9-1]
MDEDTDIDTVASLLGDDCARTILEATAAEALSVEQLAERCSVSGPTVYRRLETLREQDLVTEQTRAGEDGHHYKVYRATLDRAVVDLTDEGFEIRLSRRGRMADRFTEFVEDLR